MPRKKAENLAEIIEPALIPEPKVEIVKWVGIVDGRWISYAIPTVKPTTDWRTAEEVKAGIPLWASTQL